MVGGLAADTGYRIATITPEQEAATEWLMQHLADTLGTPLEITDHIETWADSRKTKGIDAIAARDAEFMSLLHANMTDEELKACPDRITP